MKTEKEIIEYLRSELDTDPLKLRIDDTGVYFQINMSPRGKWGLSTNLNNIEIYGIVVLEAFTVVNMFISKNDLDKQQIFDS